MPDAASPPVVTGSFTVSIPRRSALTVNDALYASISLLRAQHTECSATLGQITGHGLKAASQMQGLELRMASLDRQITALTALRDEVSRGMLRP